SQISLNRLKFTRQEAEAIRELLQTTQSNSGLQLLDFEADLNAAQSPQLSQYQIVHFATHGIFNTTYPELSGLVLSLVSEQGSVKNGFLRLHEIFNLSLPAELVVLSACKTGKGREVNGEGLVGLTRGFMYAGSPRVIASLWSVNDLSTAELMASFYKHYLQENLSPAAALRTAQLDLWQSQRWRAPYYWAAFTLQGEWE
ncbi:MAG: CHAT domain-containing protein, partial [Okeania sp. SIO2D1]|nr:CHAT domain-containing protein [Okeania sp. SIO2D1]